MRRKTLLPRSVIWLCKKILDGAVTQYGFLFRRQAVVSQLERVRCLPRGLHIEGTNVCNANCRFCAYPKMQRPKGVMSMELFRSVIEQYLAIGGHCVSLTPTVGDPFLDQHLFQRLDHLNETEGIHDFYFYTNAIRMEPSQADALFRYETKLRVFVSLGGLNREGYRAIMGVDCFDRVFGNLEYLIATKLNRKSPLSVTVVLRCPKSGLCGANWSKLLEWERLGLIRTAAYPEGYDGWAGKVSDAELKQVGLRPTPMPFKKGPCDLLFSKPVVLADGKVNACACRDVEAELIIGDLNRQSLEEVWNGAALDELIQRHWRGDFPDVCLRCTYYVSVCNWRRASIFKESLNWSN